MNMMLSTCGSITYAKFAHIKQGAAHLSSQHVSWHRKQDAPHWPRQHMGEAKGIHSSKMVSSPIYSMSTTFLSVNKMMENRLRTQFLSSSNYSSTHSQLGSYSSDGESSNKPSPSRVPTRHDNEILVLSLQLFINLVMAVIMLYGYFRVPPKQSIPCFVLITGLSLAFIFRRRFEYLLRTLNLPSASPSVKEGIIEAVTVEEQVTKMGLTPTNLINSEELFGILPKSLFSSEDIKNKSMNQGCAIMNKMHIRSNDREKLALITKEIKSMLQTHPKVLLGNDATFCYLYLHDQTVAGLTFGCLVENMRKDMLISLELDILLQVVRIIRQHGAEPFLLKC